MGAIAKLLGPIPLDTGVTILFMGVMLVVIIIMIKTLSAKGGSFEGVATANAMAAKRARLLQIHGPIIRDLGYAAGPSSSAPSSPAPSNLPVMNDLVSQPPIMAPPVMALPPTAFARRDGYRDPSMIMPKFGAPPMKMPRLPTSYI